MKMKLFFLTMLGVVNIDASMRLDTQILCKMRGRVHKVEKQMIVDNSTLQTIDIGSGLTLTLLTSSDAKEGALITGQLFEQRGEVRHLISQPTIKAAWGKPAEIRIASNDETELFTLHVTATQL